MKTFDFSVYKLTCKEPDAGKFAEWIRSGGGVAHWPTLYIGSDTTWSTPVLDEHGDPYPKPDWKAAGEPDLIITDPEEIGVITYTEFVRFHVALRRSSNGLSLKLTDASNTKLNKKLEQAGVGATYAFDYMTQEAVILQPTNVISLGRWMREHPVLSQNPPKEG